MSATPTQKHGPVHTYWLYSDGGGMLGPFTKAEARAVVEESPDIRFRARRDGEVRWKDAEVRLAPPKSTGGLLWLIAFVLVISLLGIWWSANQHHRSLGESAAHLQPTEVQPSEAATPDAAKNPEGIAAEATPSPLASLPR